VDGAAEGRRAGLAAVALQRGERCRRGRQWVGGAGFAAAAAGRAEVPAAVESGGVGSRCSKEGRARGDGNG